MSSVRSLFGTIDRPIVVIGGSPSKIKDFAKVPRGCYVIAVNQHCNGMTEPDLAVFSHKYWEKNIDSSCKTVGPTGDYKYDLPAPNGFYSMSGYKAAKVALNMTDKEVYICGIDCYSSKNDYFGVEGKSEGYETDTCMKGWIEINNNYPNRLIFSSELIKGAINEN